MELYKNLANATLQILCGNSSGSGFQLLNKDIVITNHHVIEPYFFQEGLQIEGFYENGTRCLMKLIGYSNKMEYDFAILKVIKTENISPSILQPRLSEGFERGTGIVFSGFPHGIPHLLTHSAIISAQIEKGFYIDGSVNGGNSGGPIIDTNDGKVIGIVTQRRYMGGGNIQQILHESQQLQKHFHSMSKGGNVIMMGIDFADFALKMANTNKILSDVLAQNANSGIGIGFDIRFVFDKLKELGIDN